MPNPQSTISYVRDVSEAYAERYHDRGPRYQFVIFECPSLEEAKRISKAYEAIRRPHTVHLETQVRDNHELSNGRTSPYGVTVWLNKYPTAYYSVLFPDFLAVTESLEKKGVIPKGSLTNHGIKAPEDLMDSITHENLQARIERLGL
jgi:hypothetical protein